MTASAIDHLVVFADSLEQGAAWCEATLGVAPGPGGQHPLMGTHNRLLRIDGPGFANAYLEILAIDPAATPPKRARWFGIDDPALLARVKQTPQLIHAVLRTTNVEMMRWGLINKGLNPGVPLALQRPTPEGLLQWRMLVRDDGRIEAGGALPTLIEWQGIHPTEAMPMSSVQLEGVTLSGLSEPVRTVLRTQGVAWAAESGAPALQLSLQTPRGTVVLATG